MSEEDARARRGAPAPPSAGEGPGEGPGESAVDALLHAAHLAAPHQLPGIVAAQARRLARVIAATGFVVSP